MWGDNDTMINSVKFLDAPDHKHHNTLSFHVVCKIIAAKYINLYHSKSDFNITDLVSKYWGYQSIYQYWSSF